MEKVFNEHEFVDLGLPSGTLWAKRNVGANVETDTGIYFQWGDVEKFKPHTESFSWHGYKFGTGENLKKYNEKDNITVLDLEDDAAHVNMGGDWRMPTKEDFDELLEYTTSEWVTINNIYGRKFISINNGNTLFFPASGNMLYKSISSFGFMGEYFSSSLEKEYLYSAYKLHFSATKLCISTYSRDFACCIRGVI